MRNFVGALIALLGAAVFWAVGTYDLLASMLARLRNRGPVGIFLADLAVSRGVAVVLFFVAAFLIANGIRENSKHKKKGAKMPDKDDDKPGTRYGDITGDKPRVAYRDYYEQAPPPQPLPTSKYTHHEEKVSTDNPETPYGLKVVVQTTTIRHPTSVAVICDSEIDSGDYRIVGVGGEMDSGTGFVNDKKGFWVFFREPPFRPEAPLVVTLKSKNPIRVLGVIDGPPNPFG